MLIDLAKEPLLPELKADVCVVGAGAAGISLTRQLIHAGHHVILLESGGLDFDSATQDLYAGPNIGMTYYDLVDARLRFFGGTTNIWGGRCTPMEPIDFQTRSWVSHSGWPISSQELEPHYQAAHQNLDLGDYSYDESLWRHAPHAAPAFDPQSLMTSPKVTLLLHANVVHLQAHQDANHINHLAIATLQGQHHDVSAQAYVLACGGIENPRLLLASNDVEPAGIGNRFDQVGRYFMEHQHGRAGQVHTDDPYRLWSFFRKFKPSAGGPPLAPTLLPAAEAQEKHGILNTALTFKLQRDPEQGLLLNDRLYRKLKHQLPPDRSRRKLWHTYRDVRGWIQRNIKPTVERLRSGKGSRNLYLIVRAEQAPNPSSRVTLSHEKDALGMPRAALDWQLSQQDKETVSALCKICDSEFKRLGIGRVEAAQWLAESSTEWPVDPTISKHPIGGYHHMGTTRMSSDPKKGVVDAQCRVHDYDNLYIAGSSTFATGGWANPTLTLLALTHRLGEHLTTHISKHANVS